jgi:predicted membrane protein
MREKRNVYRFMVRKPERKKPLGRSRHRWMNNIKMYIEEVEWDDVNWIGLAEDIDRWRVLVNTVMNFQVP